MDMEIRLDMQEMTPEVMQSLEERGMIIRLCPGRFETNVPEGQVGVQEVYRTDLRYGSHMLIGATINRVDFSAFATHPENEDVFLIGDENTKTMCFLFALCDREKFEAKVAAETLTSNDFVALKARYNDFEVSCFTVVKGVPHGEAVMAGEGKPPTFFVTEQTDLPLDLIDFGKYRLIVNGLD